MKDTIINFETAKLAKLKGFDWECDNVYKQPIYTQRGTDIKEKREYRIFNNCYEYSSITEITFSKKEYSAPTQSLLQKWLREKHNIEVYIIPWVYNNKTVYDFFVNYEGESMAYSTYELALETSLIEGLKLIK